MANSRLVSLLAGNSSEKIWCPTSGGEVFAALDDLVGRAAFYCGDLDPKVSWVCRKLVRPGDTAFDIGANIGIITLLLSQLVGQGGKVYAFEPNPPIWESLRAALARNRTANVEAHPYALGSVSEERELVVPQDNAGASSFIRSTDIVGNRSVRVQVRTLDEFIVERNVQSIQFMKIDVEGFEGEVLAGGRRMLETIRPEAILFEMNDESTATLIEIPVFKILAEADYRFLSLPKSLLRMRPREFNPRKETKLVGNDVIATPNGELFRASVAKLHAER